MRPDLLLFDLDGTLIDSTADIATAVNRTLADYDLPPRDVDEVRRFIGDGAVKLAERAFPERLHNGLTEILTRFRAHYAEVSTLETRPYAGVDAMLEALVDVPMALCTNKPIAFVPELLDRFGWAGRFSPTLGGDSLATHKPDPAMLLHCCEQRGVEPQYALMIGDGVQDVRAAHNAGVPVVAVTWGFRDRAMLAAESPASIIDHPSELVELVRGSGAVERE